MMHRFSITNIEALTGVKAHTLRMWEQRYQILTAYKKEGKYRPLSANDLQKLLSIAMLYHAGWKITKIASLPTDEDINSAVQHLQFKEFKPIIYIQQLLSAAIDLNEARFAQLLNEVVIKLGFEKTVVEICYPYLQKVALLWDNNRITPVQEHFSTYLIKNRIISETERFSFEQSSAPEIILYCPDDEEADLPLLFINYLLRKNGWKVLYLGTTIKLADLEQTLKLQSIQFLYVHFLSVVTAMDIDDYLEILRKRFPSRKIITSGQGLESSQRKFVNVTLLKRDADIYKFIQSKP